MERPTTVSSANVSRASSYSPQESLDYTALQVAVLKGSLDEAGRLLESGEDVNAGLDPPLHMAVRRRDVLMARFLLQTGADFEIRDSVFGRSAVLVVGADRTTFSLGIIRYT